MAASGEKRRPPTGTSDGRPRGGSHGRRQSVLLGKNNSGKTAAARLPLLMLSAVARRPGRLRDPIPLSSRGLEYGSSIVDLVYGENPHADFGIGCTARSAHIGGELALWLKIQLRQTLAGGRSSFVADFDAAPLLPSVHWIRDVELDEVRYSDSRVIQFDGMLPRYSDTDLQSKVEDVRRAGGQVLDEFVHLTSLRRPLDPVYENRSHDGQADPAGADVPYLLNESDALFAAVADWYGQRLGTRIEISREAAAFRLVVGGPRGDAHNLARAGQGIQQALPVVTHLQAMALGLGTQFLVVEEPELNLHPAAHGDLADLAVQAHLANTRAQVLVETHSENFVLRLRYRVATGQLRPDDVNLLWFQQDDGATSVKEIHIYEDGSVSDWPTGVFSEDLAEARAIAKANQL